MNHLQNITGSGLERTEKCPASVTLPQVRQIDGSAYADRGSAVHLFLADCAVHGREAALEAVPEEHHAFCEGIDIAALPDLSSVAAEVAFAYDLQTGDARELGRGGGRNYSAAGPTEIAGTADVIGIIERGSARGVFVGDYKTGWRVPRVEDSLQLRFYALCAARAYGASFAVLAMLRIREDGTIWTDVCEIGALEIDVFAGDVETIVRATEAERPRVATGDHCRYCPAYASCPAHTALVKQIDNGAHPVLTEQTAARLWRWVQDAERFVSQVRKSIEGFARQSPIPLTDDTELAEVETTRRSLDGGKAVAVLRALGYGDETVDAAADFRVSQSSARKAIQQAIRGTGTKITHAFDAFMAALEQSNGVRAKVTKSIRERRRQGPSVDLGRETEGSAGQMDDPGEDAPAVLTRAPEGASAGPGDTEESVT